jgi:hypothetical protein
MALRDTKTDLNGTQCFGLQLVHTVTGGRGGHKYGDLVFQVWVGREADDLALWKKITATKVNDVKTGYLFPWEEKYLYGKLFQGRLWLSKGCFGNGKNDDTVF